LVDIDIKYDFTLGSVIAKIQISVEKKNVRENCIILFKKTGQKKTSRRGTVIMYHHTFQKHWTKEEKSTRHVHQEMLYNGTCQETVNERRQVDEARS